MSGTFFAAIGGMVVGSAVTFMLLSKKEEEDTKGSQSAPSSSSPVSKKIRSSDSGAIDRSVLTVSQSEREGLLTGILAQLWDHINKAGCQIIRESVEPSLASSLPAPLNTLRFTKLDLGKVPLRLDNIVVHERENGVVQFDMDIVWDGECEIQLKADYVGSLGVKTIKFHGRMAFVMKPLTDVMPIASAVQYFFIDPPMLDLDFTGLAQVADMKMVNGKILKVINDSLADMVVLPNRMMTKVDPAVSFYNVYQPPRGFARITVLSGKGFVAEKRRMRSDDEPDVYCQISLGTSEPRKTSTVKNSVEPIWGTESFDFLLSDFQQTVTINVFDEDKGAIDSDDHLGTAHITVQQLLLAAGNRRTSLLLETDDGKPTGAEIKIRCDLLPLTSKSLTSLTTQKASPFAMGGLLTVLVSNATNIPVDSSKLGTYVKVSYGDKHEFVTPTILEDVGVDAINPAYDSAFHVPITTQDFLAGRPDVLLQILQPTDDVEKPKIIGQTSVMHSQLTRATDTTLQEKRDIGSGISLDFLVSLKGLHLEGAAVIGSPDTTPEQPSTTAPSEANTSSNAGNDVPPVIDEKSSPSGTIRLTVVKGSGFQIERRRLKKADIPDVFLKILVGTVNKCWETSVISNSTEPEWNESAAFLFSGNTDVVTVEAYDKDSGRRDGDDFLGSGQVTVGKLILSGGKMDLLLQEDGKPNGAVVTLSCEKVGA